MPEREVRIPYNKRQEAVLILRNLSHTTLQNAGSVCITNIYMFRHGASVGTNLEGAAKLAKRTQHSAVPVIYSFYTKLEVPE